MQYQKKPEIKVNPNAQNQFPKSEDHLVAQRIEVSLKFLNNFNSLLGIGV